jgi:hypothetical protein
MPTPTSPLASPKLGDVGVIITRSGLDIVRQFCPEIKLDELIASARGKQTGQLGGIAPNEAKNEAIEETYEYLTALFSKHAQDDAYTSRLYNKLITWAITPPLEKLSHNICRFFIHNNFPQDIVRRAKTGITAEFMEHLIGYATKTNAPTESIETFRNELQTTSSSIFSYYTKYPALTGLIDTTLNNALKQHYISALQHQTSTILTYYTPADAHTLIDTIRSHSTDPDSKALIEKLTATCSTATGPVAVYPPNLTQAATYLWEHYNSGEHSEVDDVTIPMIIAQHQQDIRDAQHAQRINATSHLIRPIASRPGTSQEHASLKHATSQSPTNTQARSTGPHVQPISPASDSTTALTSPPGTSQERASPKHARSQSPTSSTGPHAQRISPTPNSTTALALPPGTSQKLASFKRARFQSPVNTGTIGITR